MLVLGAITILYGSILAIRQNDMKRIVAYSSIGHMGFVILGLFSWNTLGYAGAIVIMLSHGFTTSALFLISGAIGDRLKTRDITRMGGMRAVTPRLAGYGTAFWIFALGLPGSGNFLGEFLVLSGTFQVNVPIAILGAVGAIFSLVYSLRAIFRIFDGPREVPETVKDFNARESIVTAVLVVLVLWVGLMPGTILAATTHGVPVPVAAGTPAVQPNPTTAMHGGGNG
jgi:NADH-quinone oxidoreductase subunit M